MDIDQAESRFAKYKIPIGLSLVGLVLIAGGVVSSGLNNSRSEVFPKESLVESKIITVDVAGAVNKPGVYKIKEGSRIDDVIKAVAGFSSNANQEYISKHLNMAQKVTDGSKIYIPAVGEQGSVSMQTGTVAGITSASVVSINNASQQELEALPGIGPVTASKIISGRPYNEVDELVSRKIISKTLFDKIKDSVSN